MTKDGLPLRGFHTALRSATQQDHQHIDDLYSSLDLRTRTGFIVFAQAHAASFESLAEVYTGKVSRHALADMTARLHRDLDTLAAPPIGFDLRGMIAPHPVAVDYVVSESRLGTNGLRKRWRKSPDDLVRDTDAYLGMRHDPRHWHDMRRTLTQISVLSTDARSIVEGTKAVFRLFADAFHATSKQYRESLCHA